MRQIVIYALTASLLAHFVQSTGAGTPFPTCVNVTQKCAALGGCIELSNSFAYTEEHSKNLLCIKQMTDSSPVIRPPYGLHGCPTEFFDPYQSTSGVCTDTTDDNGTDLLLTVSEMEPGLHSFSCVVPEAPNGIVSSYAVIVRDHNVYREFRILIDGVLQYHHNSTNITLDVGSDLTVVVLAVGNVSVINASDPRFICETDFACKHNPDGLSNRYLKCSLRTPAELSDDGRTLSAVIDDTEIMRFSIAVNKSSSVTDEERNEGGVDEGDGKEGASSVDPLVPAYVIAGSVVIVILAVIVLIAIIMYCLHKKRCKEHVEEGWHIEREVLKQYYEKLASILPVTNILHKLIPEGIITTDDSEEISHMSRSKDKALFILNKINRTLQADAKNSFYALLDIMEECDNHDVKDIMIDIRRTLMTVLSFHCPNCDQFWDEIKSHGYTIKKISNKTGNIPRTSLDQGIPLVMCSCSECEVPREVTQVLSSPIPVSWNVLQLHRAGNALQSNGVVHVTVTDLDNGRPLGEVLDWLKTKLPRRSSTASSVTSQRGSHYSLGQSGE